MTHRREEPIDSANEADVAEQEQDLDGSDAASEPDFPGAEVDEADALEQSASVDPDDDAYPHQGEEDPE